MGTHDKTFFASFFFVGFAPSNMLAIASFNSVCRALSCYTVDHMVDSAQQLACTSREQSPPFKLEIVPEDVSVHGFLGKPVDVDSTVFTLPGVFGPEDDVLDPTPTAKHVRMTRLAQTPTGSCSTSHPVTPGVLLSLQETGWDSFRRPGRPRSRTCHVSCAVAGSSAFPYQ